MLIEAAWSYQYPARIAKEKAEILIRLPKNIRDIAWIDFTSPYISCLLGTLHEATSPAGVKSRRQVGHVRTP